MSQHDIWVSELRAGNKAVFAEVYQEYFDQIYAFVATKIDWTQDREDIVSQVFAKAFDGILNAVKWENPQLRAWIYKIASTTVIDFYRKKAPVQLDFEQESDAESPLQYSEKQVVVDQIVEKLKELWEEVHEIFVMRFWQQLSYAEISEVNGYTIANNKQIYSRACKSLRQHFTHLSLD